MFPLKFPNLIIIITFNLNPLFIITFQIFQNPNNVN